MRLVEVVGYEADEARISHFYKWERFNDFSMDLGVEGADVEFGWGLVNIGKIGIAAMKEITIDIDQPMIIDKTTWRTLAPVRFLVEVNGGQILDWDDDTKTVKFKTFDGKEVSMQADSHKVVIKSKRW